MPRNNLTLFWSALCLKFLFERIIGVNCRRPEWHMLNGRICVRKKSTLGLVALAILSWSSWKKVLVQEEFRHCLSYTASVISIPREVKCTSLRHNYDWGQFVGHWLEVEGFRTSDFPQHCRLQAHSLKFTNSATRSKGMRLTRLTNCGHGTGQIGKEILTGPSDKDIQFVPHQNSFVKAILQEMWKINNATVHLKWYTMSSSVTKI